METDISSTIIGLLVIAAIVYSCYKDAKRKKGNRRNNTYKNNEYRYDDYYDYNNYYDTQYTRHTKRSTYHNTQKEKDINRQNSSQTSLLTPTEHSYYNQLKDTLKHYDIEIHYKVRLADMFKVKYHNKFYDTNFARIMAKHMDFVITEKNTATAIIAIELDDPSHDQESSAKNDNFKNTLFEYSNIRLLRMKVKQQYEFTELKQMLKEYLNVSFVLDGMNKTAAQRVEEKIQENRVAQQNKFNTPSVAEPEPEPIYTEIK